MTKRLAPVRQKALVGARQWGFMMACVNAIGDRQGYFGLPAAVLCRRISDRRAVARLRLSLPATLLGGAFGK